ncbi:hypothetical protein FA09DRAFT_13975 [Tilletiopsis washingtonensis]|jgi:hypothetical protein|uniref:Uncharacterized protein n=1 Tax=Tilletiopsis washingtonensis TaxID=58919 RepID=A0A316ZI14_9BASI|nr:hypothetical protein FA09DRAFT_13975 [Tilletiopsis washingtonensis]PWO01401.1 hypothetical protein FA09DRAFT_13975 [Tilletiopsis washingtonensis]
MKQLQRTGETGMGCRWREGKPLSRRELETTTRRRAGTRRAGAPGRHPIHPPTRLSCSRSLQRPPSPPLADQTAGCARSGTLARPFAHIQATRVLDATRLHHQRGLFAFPARPCGVRIHHARAASPSTRLASECASFDSSSSRSAPVFSAKSTFSKASLFWVLPGAQRWRSARPPRRAASGARARYVTSSVVTRTSALALTPPALPAVLRRHRSCSR